ncbi:MAG: lipoprotein release ABC transporter permease [Acidobacteria bacterium OLB17]|nr:MAG: lipoprotein release ABC transporter permease [Acidobacteria bacterium OLB17]MCZ2391212.1 ABC transporter permease [Acidobacteriota bacterium]
MNSLVFSNMLHRPARTAVSIVGIGVGILLIVFTVGLANGSLRERAKREANIGAEIMVRASGSLGWSGAETPRLSVSMANDIEKVEGVDRAIPIIQTSVSAKDSNTGSRIIDGVDLDSYGQVSGLTIVKGRGFSPGTNEAVCDAAFFAQKNFTIGGKIDLFGRQFTLVGIYEPSVGARIKIPLDTMQRQLDGEGRATAILVKLKPGESVDAIGERLDKSLPNTQILLTRDIEELYMQGVPALNVFLNVVIGIAGVISALIILLTMYTTVSERTRQIGVLKSLGMSNFTIGWTIVQEALLIALGGIIFGVTATIVLSLALAKWTTLTVQIDPAVVGGILVIGLFSSLIGALYPGLKAARLDAVEALSFE